MVKALGDKAWSELMERSTALGDEALAKLAPMLLIVPHQDDETLGCGGLIASASALGCAPYVAYLTDGGASHLGSDAWPRHRLVRERRREAYAALSILGVPRRNIRFLGWRDAEPVSQTDPLYRQSLAMLGRWDEAVGAAVAVVPSVGVGTALRSVSLV